MQLNIFYGEKRCGNLKVITKYIPMQVLYSTFDTEEIEAISRDEEMSNNYLQADIEALKLKIEQIQKKKLKMAHEVKLYQESIDRTKVKINRYKKVHREFGGWAKGKIDSDSMLCPILLDPDSTMVEVSDYRKDGGHHGDEWPWKVLVTADK